MGQKLINNKFGTTLTIDEIAGTYYFSLLLSPVVSFWDCIFRKTSLGNTIAGTVVMDKAVDNQAGKVLKKGKKKQAKDELDRQKQAEKKRRRLEKALANSAAIISELEKKKQKKKEEQQRLDEEGAAIAEAVALHVLIGEDSDEPCHLVLNKHRKCSHWDPLGAGFDSTQSTSDGLHAYAPRGRWTGQPLPSRGEERDDLQAAPCYQGTFRQSVTCPGFIAAQAVSSLQIREESSDITSPSQQGR